jgi:hypothetical protein
MGVAKIGEMTERESYVCILMHIKQDLVYDKHTGMLMHLVTR